jgi:hypothetical protein
MKKNNVTSLRKFRAQQIYERYYSLPVSQRTSERSAQLIEAIFDYAYEHVPKNRRHRLGYLKISPTESRRISRRLEEFMFPERPSDPDSIMKWLHAHMIPEAWTFSDDLRGLVQEYLHSG